jgi:hypothetical protein
MSVSSDIRAAVKTVISGLTLTGTPTIKERKRPAFVTGDNTSGVIIVSGIDVNSEPLTADDSFAVSGRYGIAITAVRPNSAGLTAGTTVEGWIETIREALFKPNSLPSVSEVVDVLVMSRPWFNPVGLDRNYDWAQLALMYETAESRA